METIAERLLSLIDYLGITKNAFAKSIGTSSALISKLTTQNIDFRIDILQKIVAKYSNVNLQWLLTGVGKMLIEITTENYNGLPTEITTEQILNVFQRYKMVKRNFYESCSESDIDKLLSVDIEALKDTFNSYQKLIKAANDLKAPDFLLQKFEVSDFKTEKKEIDEDIKFAHPHLKEGKTLKIILIGEYKSNIMHYRNQLTQLIDYMEQYSDFFKDQISKTI
jgi:transcriptional regulator with XRE-family HTH domain